MKISDLNNITLNDLKKIDYSKVVIAIKEKPEIAICISLIIITLFLSLNIYNNRQKELKRIKTQVAALETKQKSIDRLLTAKEETKKFLDSIPQPLTEEKMLNLITDIATHRKIVIESLSPSKQNSAAFYDAFAVSLVVSAPSYQDIWLLAYDLEKSKYGIRIDNWEMRLENSLDQQRNRPNQIPGGEGKLAVQLLLTVINFKLEAEYQNENTTH